MSAGLGAGAVLALGGALAPEADAATFNVTNLNDAGAGSLRQAVEDANAAAGADVITFQSGLTGTVTLTTGQLSITDSVDVQGPGAATFTVSGNDASRVFYLYNASSLLDVTISGLTIRDGSASSGGGIIDYDENLTLDGVALTGNAASGDGGALWADGFSMSLTIRNSTLSGNTAGDDGGGIYIEDTGGTGVLLENTVISANSAAGHGGGIYFYDPDTDVTLRGCTISGNTASGTGGGISLYSPDGGVFTFDSTTVSGNTAQAGGGIYFYNADQQAVVENCTISGNQATSGSGGGINLYSLYNGGGGVKAFAAFELRHTTVSANSASGIGGGIYVGGGSLPVANSIVADNTAGGDSDLSGSFDVSYSLVEVPGGASINDLGGNIFSQDPQLGPLQNNGGATLTRAIPLASPALNAGDPAFVPPPSADQRGTGFPRVRGGSLDMGAFEALALPGTLQLSLAAFTVTENGGVATITVTRSGGSEGAVSVSYATTNGTAVAPADYSPASGVLTWAEGDVSPRTFLVPIVDNLADNPDKTVNLTLSAPVGATLGAPATAVLTILDDDLALDIDKVIPVLPPAGLVGLSSLIGLAGAALLRRRKGLGATGLGASALAACLVAGSSLAATSAPAPSRKLTAGTVSTVAGEGQARVLRVTLAGGETMDLPLSSIEIKDRRHGAQNSPAAALAPGQAVVVKVRTGGRSGASKVTVVLFDDAEAAALKSARAARKH